MLLKDLTDMMTRTFDQHVDGLKIAQANGVKIVADPSLVNVDVEMRVSPSAFAQLRKTL